MQLLLGAAITGWMTKESEFDSQQGPEICVLFSLPGLTPTQPSVQLVLGTLSQGIKLPGPVKLVLRLRMRGAVPPFSHTIFLASCLLSGTSLRVIVIYIIVYFVLFLAYFSYRRLMRSPCCLSVYASMSIHLSVYSPLIF
jgi:hypothetical protein